MFITPYQISLRHDSCSAACIRGVAHHSLPKSFQLGGEVYQKQKSPTSFFFGLFLFQGRFLTSYGSKAHGGEICRLFLCVTLWGAIPYNGLYREALPKRVTFFRCRVYERVGISLFEVMKGQGNLSLRYMKGYKRANRRLWLSKKKKENFLIQ